MQQKKGGSCQQRQLALYLKEGARLAIDPVFNMLECTSAMQIAVRLKDPL